MKKKLLSMLLTLTMLIALLMSFGIHASATATDIGTAKALAEALTTGESQIDLRLTADIDLTEGVTIPSGKTINIDLNGKTLSAPNTAITVEGSSTYISLALTNGTVTTSSESAPAINANGGTVTLDNCTVSGNARGVEVGAWGHAYITNSEINGATALYVFNGKAYVGGDTSVSGTNYAVWTNSNAAYATLYDGVYSGSISKNGEEGTITILGGCYNTDVSDFLKKSDQDENIYKLSACSHSRSGYQDVLPIETIVKRNGVPYASLSDAIEAAFSMPSTLTLCKDTKENITIAYNQTITIDLNNYVLSGCEKEEEENAVIDNSGALTVKDSTTSNKTVHKWVPDSDENNEIPDGRWVLNDSATGTKGVDYFETSGGVITGGTQGGIRCGNENSDMPLSVTGVNIVGNQVSSNYDGGGIYTCVDAIIKDCNFYGNVSLCKGGAIASYCGKSLEVDGCDIRYNYANGNGGGIFYKGEKLDISGTVISDNVATYNGGGVYCNSDFECLAEGTKITMADGSVKNIEDVRYGDVVRTFDHETGKLSSAKVYVRYEGEKTGKAFRLKFSHGVYLDVVGLHDLFEKSSLQYVTLTEANAESYVGKYFYNANAGRYEELLSVTRQTKACKYYSLYTSQHMNCVANDMLTMPDDVDYMFKIWTINDDLKIDEAKKQADIEKYGLYDFSDCTDLSYEDYIDRNVQYSRIVVGKGIMTKEELLASKQETNQLIKQNADESGPESLSATSNDAFSCSDEVYTGLETESDASLILGSNVTIKNNSVEPEGGDPRTENLYLCEGTLIELEDGSTNINVGVSSEVTTYPVAITTNGTKNNLSYFGSDSEKCKVVFAEGDGSTTADHFELNVEDSYKWYYDREEGEDYIIHNVSELEALAALVNSGEDDFADKTIKLAEDFENVDKDGTATALKTAIGAFGKPFKGTFDGSGKTVKLNITGSEAYTGLIGYADGATIKNVATSGRAEASFVGGIVGFLSNDSLIVNCYSTCDAVCTAKVGPKSAGAAGGIVGYLFAGTVENCYATGVASNESESTIISVSLGGVVGKQNSGTVTNCFCLDLYDSSVGTKVPASQMTGIAMQTAGEDWVALGAEGSYGKVSVVDALNKGCNTGYYWGVMKEGAEPIFTLPYAIFLSEGKATAGESSIYNGDISLPDGISYDSATKTYTFENVSLAHNGGTVINFCDKDLTVVLKGDNVIGSMADTANDLSKSIISYDKRYTDIGLQFCYCDSVGSVTITGDGNLTVYDETEGITSYGNLTFDNNFTGTVTVNDCGTDKGSSCCLKSYAGDIAIQNGAFYLNNTLTYGIYAKNINITGGAIYAKGGKAAIEASEALTIDAYLGVDGASETYATGVKKLTNNGSDEYVVIKKVPLASDFAFVAPTKLTYDGTAKEAKVTSSKSGMGKITVKYFDKDGNPLDSAPVNVGTYTVKIDVADGTNYGAVNDLTAATWTFTIAPKTVTVTADNQKMTVGSTVPELTYTVRGFVSDETFTTVPTVTCTADGKTSGTYDIIVSGGEASSNYTIEYVNGTLTVSKKSDSGSKVTTYEILVSDAEHGTVTSSLGRASAGKEVTLTIKPDRGYTLETLTATDKNGKEVALTTVKLGETYTFKMPASEVTVSATFMEDNSMLNFFVDVKSNDYFYDAVLWAAENGITSGVDATHFAPMDITTRAQMVTFLWRAAGSPEPKKSKCPFVDVKTKDYYYMAVLWGYENGYVKGTSATTFSPDLTVTRGQCVTFLARMNGVKDDATGYTHSFTDVKASDYYNNAVAWASTKKITTGTTATTFAPNDDCLRGQIVTFIYRCFVK